MQTVKLNRRKDLIMYVGSGKHTNLPVFHGSYPPTKFASPKNDCLILGKPSSTDNRSMALRKWQTRLETKISFADLFCFYASLQNPTSKGLHAVDTLGCGGKATSSLPSCRIAFAGICWGEVLPGMLI